MEKIILKMKSRGNPFPDAAKKLLRIGLLVAMFLSVSVNVSARTDWKTDTHTGVEWDVNRGLAIIKVVYYDDGGGEGVGRNSASFDDVRHTDAKLNIKIDGITISLTTNDDSKSIRSFSGNTNIYIDGYGNDMIVKDNGNNDRYYWKYIYLKVPQNLLNRNHIIEFSGKYGFEGADDQTIAGSISVYTGVSISPISINSVIHTTYNNKPAIKVSWSKSASSGNADKLGKLYLREKDKITNLAEIEAVEGFSQSVRTNGEFIIDILSLCFTIGMNKS